MAAGGYSEQRYWSETGYKWRAFRKRQMADFLMLMVPPVCTCLPVAHPVRKPSPCPGIGWSRWNHHEAQALLRPVRRAGSVPYRLPSEAEHQALRRRPTAIGDDPDVTG